MKVTKSYLKELIKECIEEQKKSFVNPKKKYLKDLTDMLKKSNGNKSLSKAEQEWAAESSAELDRIREEEAKKEPEGYEHLGA